jgi:hypothetical protein
MTVDYLHGRWIISIRDIFNLYCLLDIYSPLTFKQLVVIILTYSYV